MNPKRLRIQAGISVITVVLGTILTYFTDYGMLLWFIGMPSLFDASAQFSWYLRGRKELTGRIEDVVKDEFVHRYGVAKWSVFRKNTFDRVYKEMEK